MFDWSHFCQSNFSNEKKCKPKKKCRPIPPTPQVDSIYIPYASGSAGTLSLQYVPFPGQHDNGGTTAFGSQAQIVTPNDDHSHTTWTYNNFGFVEEATFLVPATKIVSFGGRIIPQAPQQEDVIIQMGLYTTTSTSSPEIFQLVTPFATAILPAGSTNVVEFAATNLSIALPVGTTLAPGIFVVGTSGTRGIGLTATFSGGAVLQIVH